MKTLAFLFAASLSAASFSPAGEVLSVLLIDGQNNHNWKSTTPIMQAALEKSGRFKVEVSTAPANNAAQDQWAKWRPEFVKYKAVISNYNGQDWPAEVRKAFEEYVTGGGGFVCIHAANNSFPNWSEYNKMIGLGGWGGRNEKSGPYLYVKDGALVRDTNPGAGGHHGAQHEFTVSLFEKGREHPITKGMPSTWLHAKDELYDMLRGPAENVTVLATSPSPETKRDEPMIMVIDHGKGRVFHTPMGHADYSMKCVGFQTVLLRGTEWAATGKVTIPVPAEFPTKDKVLAAP
jgi:type 1 glutamine amidotransferase